MPQSLSAVYIHLVFSTKDRRPLLRDRPTRDALHSYLGGVSKQLDCPPILVGGVEDHIHPFPPARLNSATTPSLERAVFCASPFAHSRTQESSSACLLWRVEAT